MASSHNTPMSATDGMNRAGASFMGAGFEQPYAGAAMAPSSGVPSTVTPLAFIPGHSYVNAGPPQLQSPAHQMAPMVFGSTGLPVVSAMPPHGHLMMAPGQPLPQPSVRNLCQICGDRASGKHYSVYSCEGCKGFFKRTIRKDLTYVCRENKDCKVDKKQRNRCQYCRFKKCQEMGMKQEAVQEERHRKDQALDTKCESPTTSCHSDALSDRDGLLKKVLAAEETYRIDNWQLRDTSAVVDSDTQMRLLCDAANEEVDLLQNWAKALPKFAELSVHDQNLLLKASWYELVVTSVAFRTMRHTAWSNPAGPLGVVIGKNLLFHRSTIEAWNIKALYERFCQELVLKMHSIQLDDTELACLKAIILFNPDIGNLQSCRIVDQIRESLFLALEKHSTKVSRRHGQTHNEANRFAALLLRLPAIRSIGLKTFEHFCVYVCSRPRPSLPLDDALIALSGIRKEDEFDSASNSSSAVDSPSSFHARSSMADPSPSQYPLPVEHFFAPTSSTAVKMESSQ